MRSTKLQMLKSAHCQASLGREIEDVLTWVQEQNEAVDVRVQMSSFGALDKWSYDEARKAICHDSGKFFSIDGIRVRTNWGYVAEWEQPIINQPEVGYLGFLVREFDGVLNFLMQAKIEPGNVNKVQLSPTLQATRSNFTRVHEGRSPAYLEYFQKARPHQVLVDQLQSEQGARFLRKRNRNIVVWLEEEIEVKPNFIWLTLGQIKSLMAYDHVVNMDSRTVIAGLPYGSHDEDVIDFFRYLNGGGNGSGTGSGSESTAGNGPGSGNGTGSNPAAGDFLMSTLKEEGALHTIDEIISKITHFKSVYDLEVTKTDLKMLDQWVYSDTEIYHQDRTFFRVIPVDVEIGNREVQRWSQPMVQPAQEGLCAFVCRRIDGLLHVAMQLKMECGNHDVVELAPTVQTLTGNYKTTRPGAIPFLDYVLSAPEDQIVFDTMQSEEGGRFYQEQNRNMIVILPDAPVVGEGGSGADVQYTQELYGELPENYVWMTLHQLGTFLKFNNYLNIQARSLIAAISFQ